MSDPTRCSSSSTVRDPAGRPDEGRSDPAPAASPLRSALIQRKLARRVAQRKASGPADTGAIHEIAETGVQGASGSMPHRAEIQAGFGRHDISAVRAFTGEAATRASTAIGAEAYAMGDAVAFAGQPSLHTAAHEAAHVVQQRAGISLKGGVGEADDAYERHADEVADAIVAGRSAEAILDQGPGIRDGTGTRGGGVQRMEMEEAATLAPLVARARSNNKVSVELQQRIRAVLDRLEQGNNLSKLSADGELRDKLGKLDGKDELTVSQSLTEIEGAARRLSGDTMHAIGELTVGASGATHAELDLGDGKQFDADNYIIQGNARIVVETKDTVKALVAKLKEGTQHSRLIAWVRRTSAVNPHAAQYFVRQADRDFDQVLDENKPVLSSMDALEKAMTEVGSIACVDHVIAFGDHRFTARQLREVYRKAIDYLSAARADGKKLGEVVKSTFTTVDSTIDAITRGYSKGHAPDAEKEGGP